MDPADITSPLEQDDCIADKLSSLLAGCESSRRDILAQFDASNAKLNEEVARIFHDFSVHVESESPDWHRQLPLLIARLNAQDTNARKTEADKSAQLAALYERQAASIRSLAALGRSLLQEAPVEGIGKNVDGLHLEVATCEPSPPSDFDAQVDDALQQQPGRADAASSPRPRPPRATGRQTNNSAASSLDIDGASAHIFSDVLSTPGHSRHTTPGANNQTKRKQPPIETLTAASSRSSKRAKSSLAVSRTVSFDEVYQDGDASIWHWIFKYPEAPGKWFVVMCMEHHVFFGPNALAGAAKHLNSRSHNNMPKNFRIALETLGYEVTGCSEELAQRNNAKAQKAWNAGYRPPNRARRRGVRYAAMDEPDDDSRDDESDSTLEVDQNPNPITRPETGRLYYTCWPEDGLYYLVIILGWAEQPKCGMNEVEGRNLAQIGLVHRRSTGPKIPACYRINWSRSSIAGWAAGYEDDGPLESEREFPVLFFQEGINMSSWVHAHSLFEFDPENPKLDDPKYILSPHKYKEAIQAYAMAMGFPSYEALKAHKQKTDDAIASKKEPSPGRKASPRDSPSHSDKVLDHPPNSTTSPAHAEGNTSPPHKPDHGDDVPLRDGEAIFIYDEDEDDMDYVEEEDDGLSDSDISVDSDVVMTESEFGLSNGKATPLKSSQISSHKSTSEQPMTNNAPEPVLHAPTESPGVKTRVSTIQEAPENASVNTEPVSDASVHKTASKTTTPPPQAPPGNTSGYTTSQTSTQAPVPEVRTNIPTIQNLMTQEQLVDSDDILQKFAEQALARSTSGVADQLSLPSNEHPVSLNAEPKNSAKRVGMEPQPQDERGQDSRRDPKAIMAHPLPHNPGGGGTPANGPHFDSNNTLKTTLAHPLPNRPLQAAGMSANGLAYRGNTILREPMVRTPEPQNVGVLGHGNTPFINQSVQGLLDQKRRAVMAQMAPNVTGLENPREMNTKAHAGTSKPPPAGLKGNNGPRQLSKTWPTEARRQSEQNVAPASISALGDRSSRGPQAGPVQAQAASTSTHSILRFVPVQPLPTPAQVTTAQPFAPSSGNTWRQNAIIPAQSIIPSILAKPPPMATNPQPNAPHDVNREPSLGTTASTRTNDDATESRERSTLPPPRPGAPVGAGEAASFGDSGSKVSPPPMSRSHTGTPPLTGPRGTTPGAAVSFFIVAYSYGDFAWTAPSTEQPIRLTTRSLGSHEIADTETGQTPSLLIDPGLVTSTERLPDAGDKLARVVLNMQVDGKATEQHVTFAAREIGEKMTATRQARQFFLWVRKNMFMATASQKGDGNALAPTAVKMSSM